VDVPALFDRYEWGYETVEAGIWRSNFADEQDEEFDLYVAAGEDWLHFAVTPLTPVPAPECREKLTSLLLRLNQTVRLVRFAIDGDGDVTLLADLPMAGLSFILFAATLDALIHYTRELGSMLARTATEPCFEYFLS
jgi:hypothetical protein